MRRWRRVHKLLFGAIAVQILAGAAVIAAIVLLVQAADDVSVAAAVCAAVLATWAVRKYFTGVFISDTGVRIRATTNTMTFGWDDIAAIEARTSSHAAELGGPWSSLWITTAAGPPIETAVIRGS